MTPNFESRKNIRAGSYTLIICSCLLIMFFFIRWTTPAFPQPVIEEGIEVNLGSSDEGMGTDQPYEPGTPAPQEQQRYTPPKATVTENTPVKEVETNDDEKEDAPVVKKPPVPKADATKIAEKDIVKNPPVKATQPVENPVPAPRNPKAVFKGASGTGTGGNEADSYKKGNSEGIAGGKGDQGKPGGDPNSKNYEGNGGTGNSGVSISRGLQGRRFTSLPSFEDEFNENAKVAINIKVDETGKVTAAAYEPRGSTTSDASLKSIATRKAMQIKFNAGSEETSGTIIFNFKLRN
ncbi:MAG: hypothetical protein WKF89_00810 [Chitinophagaceae bacterium]